MRSIFTAIFASAVEESIKGYATQSLNVDEPQ